jgi:hypothetical protein
MHKMMQEPFNTSYLEEEAESLIAVKKFTESRPIMLCAADYFIK